MLSAFDAGFVNGEYTFITINTDTCKFINEKVKYNSENKQISIDSLSYIRLK